MRKFASAEKLNNSFLCHFFSSLGVDHLLCVIVFFFFNRALLLLLLKSLFFEHLLLELGFDLLVLEMLFPDQIALHLLYLENLVVRHYILHAEQLDVVL